MTADRDPTVTLAVRGAHHPSDRGNSAGSEHLAVTADYVRGRMRRKAGDPLCKPAAKFWGLHNTPERRPTCKRCLDIAKRHGLDLPPRVEQDSARVRVVIEGGERGRVIESPSVEVSPAGVSWQAGRGVLFGVEVRAGAPSGESDGEVTP